MKWTTQPRIGTGVIIRKLRAGVASTVGRGRLDRPVTDEQEEHAPHSDDPMHRGQQIVLTVNELAGDELECLIQQHDRQWELHHSDPFLGRQWAGLEHSLKHTADVLVLSCASSWHRLWKLYCERSHSLKNQQLEILELGLTYPRAHLERFKIIFVSSARKENNSQPLHFPVTMLKTRMLH